MERDPSATPACENCGHPVEAFGTHRCNYHLPPRKPHQTGENASQIDAYFDGMRQYTDNAGRIAPDHFTPAATKEWLRGFDDQKEADSSNAE